MPNNQALQVFYGTIPLIAIIAGVWFREQLLLKDILARLTGYDARFVSVEAKLDNIRTELGKVRERLVTLETRAGVIFHE
jgi:hypothetical protein